MYWNYFIEFNDMLYVDIIIIVKLVKYFRVNFSRLFLILCVYGNVNSK